MAKLKWTTVRSGVRSGDKTSYCATVNKRHLEVFRSGVAFAYAVDWVIRGYAGNCRAAKTAAENFAQCPPLDRARAIAEDVDDQRRSAEAAERDHQRPALEKQVRALCEGKLEPTFVRLLSLAELHGLDEPEHEVGDLQDLAQICWEHLTPKVRAKVAAEYIDKMCDNFPQDEE